MDAFLSELTRKGANYAVLRWFETLPAVEAGEDIDLLVSDEDLPILEAALSPYPLVPRTQPVDLYSVSGMRGTDFRGVPYFPKNLSEQVLENAILLHGKYRVPAPRDHFHSLAFHAVYHKGEASGLPPSADELPSCTEVDHDYAAALRKVQSQFGNSAELTLEGLDRELARKGLRPPADLLERYQGRNPWLRRQIASRREEIGRATGLIAFILRERAAAYIDDATSIVENNGFELLDVVRLDAEERARVAARVRGGNWACGPFPRAGGDPVAILIAYDVSYEPEAAPDGQLVNAKASAVKHAIRALIQEGVPDAERYNPLHSTDNGWQTLECLEALGGAGLRKLVLKQIDSIHQQLELPWPVLRTVPGASGRARCVIVDHPQHGEVLAKIFPPGSIQYFQREVGALEALAGVPCVPKLLDRGKNWLLVRTYSDTGEHLARKLPGSGAAQLTFRAISSLAQFVLALRARNSFLPGLTADKIVTDPKAGLLITNFEMVQQYPGELPPLAADWTVTGGAKHPHCEMPLEAFAAERRFPNVKSVFDLAVSGLPIHHLLPPRAAAQLRMAGCQFGWRAVALVNHRMRSVAERRSVRLVARLLRRTARVSSVFAGPGKRSVAQSTTAAHLLQAESNGQPNVASAPQAAAALARSGATPVRAVTPRHAPHLHS